MNADDDRGLATETSFLLFHLDRQTYAIALEQVERVERIVEISPLPNSARGIAGVINYHGRPLQVLDLRCLFNLPPRERMVDDVLVLAKFADDRMAAFMADRVDGVAMWRGEDIAGPQLNEAPGIRGIVRQRDKMVYICDLPTVTTDDWPGPAATERSVAANEQSGRRDDNMGERTAGANQPNGGTGTGAGVCGGTLA